MRSATTGWPTKSSTSPMTARTTTSRGSGTPVALEARVRAAAQGNVGVLTLGFNETVSWGSVIPKSVYEFRRRYPDVMLTMQPMRSVDQVAALHAITIVSLITVGRKGFGWTSYRRRWTAPRS